MSEWRLASQGGNLLEALRIGRLIRQLALEVRAPVDRARPLVYLQNADNNTCASACFFLYVAGVTRQGSVVGIHKPALPADEYFAIGLDGSVAAHQRIEEATVAYLDLMGAPARYAPLMLTISSGTMVWLPPHASPGISPASLRDTTNSSEPVARRTPRGRAAPNRSACRGSSPNCKRNGGSARDGTCSDTSRPRQTKLRPTGAKMSRSCRSQLRSTSKRNVFPRSSPPS